MKRKIISTNPGKNYKVLGEVAVSTKSDIRKAVEQAHLVKESWKQLGVEKRIKFLRKRYQRFVNTQDEFKKLIVSEIGKTVKVAGNTFQRFLNDFEWLLDNGQKALAAEITHEDETSIHRVVYEPYGVAGVIAPWNHPFGMFVWGVIPNLIAGNVVVFKHSEECPLSGKFIDKVIKGGNLPEHVFTQIYGDGEQGGMLLNQGINLIWFTGSTKIGQQIYAKAGKKFIKAVLEMGGSNPGIVFEDADIDRFTQKFYAKRFYNCGQACDALKRLIVHQSVFDEVVEKLKRVIQTKVVGENDDPRSDIGSLAAKRQLDLLELQVKDAVDKSANVVVGGNKPVGLQGAYYEPTILTAVTRDMRVWKEEVFGPVLIIVSFDTEDDAVKLANDTLYGLGALVFTKDKERGRRVAAKLQSGTVEINSATHWLPCNPFGGYKKSGMGREHGIYGFRELCQIKVISEEK